MDVALHLGDCADVLMTLPPESIDLTVTSPPYDNLRKYKGYKFDFEKIARGLWYATKPGGVVVWVVSDATINGSETGTSFRQALYFMSLGFNLHDTMIYRVNGTGAKGSNRAYWQEFEYVFVLSKGKAKTFNPIRDRQNKKTINFSKGRNTKQDGKSVSPTIVIPCEFSKRGNVWTYNAGFTNTDDRTGHPAPFPESLARDHILSWSNPGDTVLDPMMGSGTTGKMAVLNNRNFIGIEISAEYMEIAQKRIEAAQKEKETA